MVITMGKTSSFLIPSGNLLWANHPVFPEFRSFAIMLILSCVYDFPWFWRPDLGRPSCFRRGHSSQEFFTLSLDNIYYLRYQWVKQHMTNNLCSVERGTWNSHTIRKPQSQTEKVWNCGVRVSWISSFSDCLWKASSVDKKFCNAPDDCRSAQAYLVLLCFAL